MAGKKRKKSQQVPAGRTAGTQRDATGPSETGAGFVSMMDLIAGDPELQAITLDDVAATYNISKRSLQRYVSDGKLHAVRFGRKAVVTVGELRRFLSARGAA